MSGSLALLGRTAVADFCLDRNHCRSCLVSLSLLDSLSDLFNIITVLNNKCLEAERLEALLYILGKCYVRTTLYGNLVGVIEHDELAKSKCSRK